MSRRFLAFAIVGGFAALVNWCARLALSLIMPLEPAVILAYLIGMTTAFSLNKFFVFEASGRTMRDEYLRFAMVNGVALVQVFCVTVILSRFFFPLIGFQWRPDAVAHALGVASPIVTSYLGHRHFTFAKRRHG